MKGRNFRNDRGIINWDDDDPFRLNNCERDSGDDNKPLYTDMNKVRVCYSVIAKNLKKTNKYANLPCEDLEEISANIVLEIAEALFKNKIEFTNQIALELLFPLSNHFFNMRYKSISNFEKFCEKNNINEIGKIILWASRKALRKEARGTKPAKNITSVINNATICTKPAILEECMFPYEENGTNTHEDIMIELIDKRKRAERLLKESKMKLKKN